MCGLRGFPFGHCGRCRIFSVPSWADLAEAVVVNVLCTSLIKTRTKKKSEMRPTAGSEWLHRARELQMASPQSGRFRNYRTLIRCAPPMEHRGCFCTPPPSGLARCSPSSTRCGGQSLTVRPIPVVRLCPPLPHIFPLFKHDCAATTRWPHPSIPIVEECARARSLQGRLSRGFVRWPPLFDAFPPRRRGEGRPQTCTCRPNQLGVDARGATSWRPAPHIRWILWSPLQWSYSAGSLSLARPWS